ncbi:MAG TPA: RcnB family protein [Rhizomicrobium sp.]|jgi:Ni/Co efflux regulator RcnB|nr:RcnB family protein [Rhizomicrobium sp.]
MKTMFLSATALALVLSLPALAADDHHGHGGGHAGGGGHTAVTPPPGGGAMHAAPDTGHHDHPGHGDVDHPHGGNTNTNNGANNGAALFTGGAGSHHDRGGNGGAPNNTRTHAGRGHNSAFDALRRAFNAPRHYHHGTYHRPNGYYAHRWTFGETLPALFFSRSYWIDDYSDFDLSDPPPGTTWVRYGNDALLIDEDSGEVIQVVYGIFY